MKNFIKTKLLYPVRDFVFNVIDIIDKFKEFMDIDYECITQYECINCKKIFEKPQKCECGGTRYIVDPQKYIVEGNKILCGCKKGELNHQYHSDSSNGFAEHFICSSCNNEISIFQYIDFEEYKRTRLKKDAASDRYVLKEDDLYRNMPWNRNKI